MPRPTFHEKAWRLNLGKRSAEKEEDLADRKAALEIVKMEKDLSRPLWKDNLQVWTTIVTSMGVIATLLISGFQVWKAQNTRRADSFEQALKHLGSESARERLTGIAELEEFQNDKAYSFLTLKSLAGAAMVETEPMVRSAAVEVFTNADFQKHDDAVKSQVLKILIERNRDYWKEIRRRQHLDEDEYARNAEEIGPNLEKADPQLIQNLETSAALLSAMVRAKVRGQSLSGVYCRGCVFSTKDEPLDLRGSDFHNAYLAQADFSYADLTSSNFFDARLEKTVFDHAVLKSADLRFGGKPRIYFLSRDADYIPNVPGTFYGCADLQGADFSGRTVMRPRHVENDEFSGANLGGAHLRQAYALVPFPKNSEWVTPLTLDEEYVRGILKPIPQTLDAAVGPLAHAKNVNNADLSEATKNVIMREHDSFYGDEECPSVNFP